MDAVRVSGLKKSFGDFQAVKGISFEIKEGSFTAFLGPNGAGKSTTISIISSLAKQDSGSVSIFGKEPFDAKTDIGVVFQDSKLDDRLSVKDNITIRASMYGIKSKDPRIAKAMEEAGCTEFANRKYGNLSGGQRRRVDIARAIVHRPRLLILDEPTTGLDPKSRQDIWELVNRLKDNGITVMLTTHYMEEAEGADDIIIISKGEIIARGTPQILRDTYCSDSMTFTVSDRNEAIARLSGVDYTENEGRFKIPLKRTADSIPYINKLSGLITAIEIRTGTLDQAFIEITGADNEY